jgi:hypothetical protein
LTILPLLFTLKSTKCPLSLFLLPRILPMTYTTTMHISQPLFILLGSGASLALPSSFHSLPSPLLHFHVPLQYIFHPPALPTPPNQTCPAPSSPRSSPLFQQSCLLSTSEKCT